MSRDGIRSAAGGRTAPQTALEARDLEVRLRSRSGEFCLRVDAVDVRMGEVLTLLGPNGAGKSTLLRTLAGLLPAERGVIRRCTEGDVTMVFQRPIPFAGSVEHNLRATLRGRRLSRPEIAERVGEALELFGISSLAARRAETLSGGELRRLVLARAFALRPAVLLLDEPFDDLDNAGQEALSLDLRRAIADTGVGVTVVTHDLRRALLLSDRIAVLMDGRVAQIGMRHEVLAYPASPDIARQVGMSNLIPGKIAALAGTPQRDGSREGWAIEVDASHSIEISRPLEIGAKVWAGIRPEYLKLDSGRARGVEMGKGVVRSLVSDGVICSVDVEWAGLELRTYFLAGSSKEQAVHVGDSVLLSVRPENVHIMER